jgi:hypothetical protein
MAEKELNLFQLSAIDMAQFCASSPKILWSEMVQLHSLSATSNDERRTRWQQGGETPRRFQRQSASLLPLMPAP